MNLIKVARYFDDAHSNYHAQFTNDVLVILDTALDASLIQEGLAREVINRVQRLRKKANLQATDQVLYYWQMIHDEQDQLANMAKEQKDLLAKYLKQEILEYDQNISAERFIIEEDQEVTKIDTSVMNIYR